MQPQRLFNKLLAEETAAYVTAYCKSQRSVSMPPEPHRLTAADTLLLESIWLRIELNRQSGKSVDFLNEAWHYVYNGTKQ